MAERQFSAGRSVLLAVGALAIVSVPMWYVLSVLSMNTLDDRGRSLAILALAAIAFMTVAIVVAAFFARRGERGGTGRTAAMVVGFAAALVTLMLIFMVDSSRRTSAIEVPPAAPGTNSP